jgi:hypothetical protein
LSFGRRHSSEDADERLYRPDSRHGRYESPALGRASLLVLWDHLPIGAAREMSASTSLTVARSERFNTRAQPDIRYSALSRALIYDWGMTNASILQALISACSAILGALIAGITLLRVADKNQAHGSAQELRRAKLAKGEELVGVLSELSSWRARDDQQLLTEIAQLEAKLNRAYALAITYYGDEENVASNFYTQGREVIDRLNESAEEYLGSSPPVDLKSIHFKYLVFQATSRDLTGWVLDEMRRVNGAN